MLWISKIEINPVTRVGMNIEATKIPSTSVRPGVRRWTSAYPASTAIVVVISIVATVTTIELRKFCGSVSIEVSAVP